MLGRAEKSPAPVIDVQAADESRAEGRDQVGILTETLEGPAPANVLRHTDGGGEGPVDVGRNQLASGDARNALHEIGVAGRAEPDVVWKDGRPSQVVVAVNCVDSVKQRYAQPALEGLGLHLANHPRPCLGRIRNRTASAAAQH